MLNFLLITFVGVVSCGTDQQPTKVEVRFIKEPEGRCLYELTKLRECYDKFGETDERCQQKAVDFTKCRRID